MTVSASAPGTYTDMQGLARLRASAAQDPQQALHQVAQQFESIFVDMMLKGMRDTSFGDPLFDSHEGDMYREMLDHQVAMNMAAHQGIGLAAMIERQLGGAPAPVAATGQSSGLGEIRLPRVSRADAPMRVDEALVEDTHTGAVPQSAGAAAPPTADVPVTAGSAPPGRFTDPAHFVTAIWPHARRAAAELGVSPEILVAQASLETGWGRAVARHADGRSSHNLFNIKAGGHWEGARVGVPTVEFQDGVAVKTRASFRAYGSYSESFSDYVHLLRSNPRYRVALEKAGNASEFVQELQRAGYATDPQYASKINRIMVAPAFHEALAAIKFSPAGDAKWLEANSL